MFPQKRHRTHSKSNFWLETGDSTCLYPHRHSGILPSGLHVYGAHTTATVGGSAVWLWFPFSLLWTVFPLINLMLLNRCAVFISHLRLALGEVYSCLCSQAAVQTVSVGKVTCWLLPSRWFCRLLLWLVHWNVFHTALEDEALMLTVTGVEGWLGTCWTYKRIGSVDEYVAYGDRIYFLNNNKELSKTKRKFRIKTPLPLKSNPTLHAQCSFSWG